MLKLDIRFLPWETQPTCFMVHSTCLFIYFFAGFSFFVLAKRKRLAIKRRQMLDLKSLGQKRVIMPQRRAYIFIYFLLSFSTEQQNISDVNRLNRKTWYSLWRGHELLLETHFISLRCKWRGGGGIPLVFSIIVIFFFLSPLQVCSHIKPQEDLRKEDAVKPEALQNIC